MKTTKKCMLTVMMLLSVCLLAGCAGSQHLSGDFDTDKVKESAEAVIKLINEGNYDTLVDTWWNAQIKVAIPAEKMKSDIQPVIEELGEFLDFDKEAVTGSTDKDTDQEFAVAVIKAKYENRNAQYTISFDKNMKVAGFYIK